MCYWVGSKKVREAMKRQFQEDPEDEIAQLYYKTFIASDKKEILKPQEYWVAIGKSKPLLTVAVVEEGQLKFKDLSWTLEWTYKDYKTGEIKQGRPLLNSTCENVFWQHKDLIYRKRCIIPVDGYFEFYHFKGNTYPHFIYPKDKGVFYLGGIWNSSVNRETGEISETFSFITTPPNPITQKLHNNPKAPSGPRMLLILDKKNASKFLDYKLTKDEIKSFFKPIDPQNMEYHPTIRFLKKEFLEFINTPKVQEPFYYPELEAA